MMLKKYFDPNRCQCWECGKTFPYLGTDSPMLQHHLWRQIAPDEPKVKWHYSDGVTAIGGDFLCKDCMEKRLGRNLEREDIIDVPFNKEFINKYFPNN